MLKFLGSESRPKINPEAVATLSGYNSYVYALAALSDFRLARAGLIS